MRSASCPGKLDEAAALIERGVELKIITDSADVARAVAGPWRALSTCWRKSTAATTAAAFSPTATELMAIAAAFPKAVEPGRRTAFGRCADPCGAVLWRETLIAEIEKIAEEERLAAVHRGGGPPARRQATRIDIVSAGFDADRTLFQGRHRA